MMRLIPFLSRLDQLFELNEVCGHNYRYENQSSLSLLYELLYNKDIKHREEVFLMEAVAYSNFRQNLRSYMKQVNEDADALIVTTKDVEDTVVVLSKRDYDSMQETLRILSNHYVMDKIRRGDEQFSKGRFKTHELLEVELDD